MSSLEPPPKCTADFCLIPMGTSTPSVSKHIAAIQKLIRSQDNVKYTMHSAGTTLEGSWTEVTTLIGQAHTLLHDNGVVRIQTDIRIGSRTDKAQSAQDKVDVVERLLAGEADLDAAVKSGVVRTGDDDEEGTGDVGAPLAS